MPYSQGVAPFYDLFGAPSDPPDEAAEFIAALGPALLPPGGSVLDIGAGTGVTAMALAARGYVVTALEPDAEMFAVLLGRLAGRFDLDARLTPIHAGAGFASGHRHDLCCCFSVLHLLPAAEQEALVGYAVAQLAEGGHLVLDMPVDTPLRQPREWATVATRTLGRLQVQHRSAMERRGERWQTHWRYVARLSNDGDGDGDGAGSSTASGGAQVVQQVDRTFDWQPLSHQRSGKLLAMHGLIVVREQAGLAGGPYVPGRSSTRLVVARRA